MVKRRRNPVKKWDVFISHATEDKDDIARPLAQGLISYKLDVWFDESERDDDRQKSYSSRMARSE